MAGEQWARGMGTSFQRPGAWEILARQVQVGEGRAAQGNALRTFRNAAMASCTRRAAVPPGAPEARTTSSRYQPPRAPKGMQAKKATAGPSCRARKKRRWAGCCRGEGSSTQPSARPRGEPRAAQNFDLGPHRVARLRFGLQPPPRAPRPVNVVAHGTSRIVPGGSALRVQVRRRSKAECPPHLATCRTRERCRAACERGRDPLGPHSVPKNTCKVAPTFSRCKGITCRRPCLPYRTIGQRSQ